VPRLNLISNPSFNLANLLTYPSFELDTTGWVAGANTTIARTTAVAAQGAGAVSLTSAAAGSVWINTDFSTNSPAVTAGLSYTASAYVRSAASARTARVRLDWYDSAGTLMYSSDGANTATLTTEWTRISVTATAPGAVSKVVVVATVSGAAAASEVHYLDAFMLEQSSLVNAYYEVTGWTGVNMTVGRATNQYLFGAASLQLTTTATSGTWTYAYAGNIIGSKSYALSAYFRSAATARSAYVQVDWLDAAGGTISSSTGSTIATSTTGWVRPSVVATAPRTAVRAICYVVLQSSGSGATSEVHYVDGALLEQSAYVNEYLDDLDQGQENTAMDLALKRVPVPHLTGAELNADIALGSLVFNTVDENGVVWVVTEVDGWWNLPTPQVPTIDRGFADGSYDVRGRFESRAITLKGVILPPDRTKLPAARARLLSAANLVYRGDWLRLDEGPVKAAWVRLVGAPTVDTVNQRGRTEFSLQLRAADPIKYEWVSGSVDGKQTTALSTNNKLASPGATTLANNGDANVAAVFSVTGPLYGPTATVKNATTNQTLTVVGALRPARSYPVTARKTDADGYSTVTLGVGRSNVQVGDSVTVASAGDDSYNGTFTVTGVTTDASPYTVQYYTGRFTESSVTGLSGTLSVGADTLKIDTYDREVSKNGVVQGSRSMVDTVVDWVYLQPGANQVTYSDSSQTVNFIKSYGRNSTQLVLTTVDSHGVYPGDSVIVLSPPALTTLGSYSAVADPTTTRYTIYLPDTRGTLSSTVLGPVVYTSTRGQVVTSVAYNSSSDVVTLTTEFNHGMAVGDYLTVDGGFTTVTYSGTTIDVAAATGAAVKINTYTWNTSTNRLTVVTDSATNYVVGDEVQVSNMGGDFDGVFLITYVSGTTLHLSVTSSTADISASTNAPTEATLYRVYRVSAVPTANTVSYVKSSISAPTGSAAVSPVAGRVYLLGNGTATASYRSGWMS